MWKAGRWKRASDEDLFAGVRYDPAPVTMLGAWIPDPTGQLRFDDEAGRLVDVDNREQRVIEVLKRLRTASGPRATALRNEIRCLVVDTWPRFGEPLDVRWLTGLTALERLVVFSNTGITGAAALAELPSLRHATLYAYGRNTIRDLDGIARSRSLESLELRWGALGDLRALSGPWPLRRLCIHENLAFSTAGIEDLPLEELELWLPEAQCELSALAALRSLRSVTLRGRLSVATAEALARCRASELRFPSLAVRPSPAAISALPDADEVALTVDSLDTNGWTGRIPLTALTAGFLDDAALRVLARAPRLRTLRVHHLDATELAPLADHPALRELRFNIAHNLRTLDRAPSAAFLEDPRIPQGPNRLVLMNNPLASLRQIGRLRGVEHLDLRACTALTSLAGVEELHELRSIDLRDCAGLWDMSALEALPSLRAVLVNHRGPLGRLPPSVQEREVHSNLRGFVRRLHQSLRIPPPG